MENKWFKEIKNNFGFGMMRLPMNENEVDIKQTKEMVDAFIENGFNYFDTAHGYIGGKSELAIKECLTSRYPRSAYLLTNKLSSSFFNSEEDIFPLFEEQLKACGVEYFDFYLMHAQDRNNYEKYKKTNAYKKAFELKALGKVKHVGLSFHDTADVLDKILTENPEIEVVQIQFNYVDYNDASVQSKDVYEVCVKHGKPVIVMEPVKGGNLVNLPEDAQKVLDELNDTKNVKASNATYAIRYAASFENMCVVLSGMSNIEQMNDNLSVMREFKPLDEEEQKAIQKVCDIFNSLAIIKCTGCHYCVLDNKCPKNIKIPEIFDCFNKKTIFHSWYQDRYYKTVLTVNNGKASDCIKCGMCEKICPQHLNIRELLVKAKEEFEK